MVPYNLVGIHNLTRDAGLHIVKEELNPPPRWPMTAQRALAVGILNHVVEVEERKISPYKWRTTSLRKRR